MNNATAQYFAEKDNRPPPGVKRMVVRRTERRRFGPYLIVSASSCGPERRHTQGSVKISLFDARGEEPDKPIAIKRFSGTTWADTQFEVHRLIHLLTGR